MIAETRPGIWRGLNEDQYLDSGVCERFLGFGFSLGCTGKFLDIVVVGFWLSFAIAIVEGGYVKRGLGFGFR